MDVKPYSWNANALNSGNYASTMPNTPEFSINGVSVPRLNASPTYGGKTYGAAVVTLKIAFVGGVIGTRIDEVYKWFDLYTTDLKQLIVTDENDSAKQYYIYATPIDITIDGATALIKLFAPDPVFKSVTENSNTWNITASGDYKDISIGGSIYAYPLFEITPTAASPTTTWAARKYVYNYNPITSGQNDTVDITFGGWDTTGLIKNTSISNQINQVGGITNSDTTIPIDTAVGGGLPASGIAYIVDGVNGDEQISYTANSGTQLTGVTRGLGGTTAVIHPDNAVINAATMLKDGRDIRVRVNGAFVDYWLGGGGINSATTKIFINLNYLGKISLTTAAAISNVGTPTQITFADTAANRTMLAKMPVRGIVIVDSEEFSYENRSVQNLSIDVLNRAVRNTTAASHSLGATCIFIQFDIAILYNNSSASAQVVDDTYKPVQILTSSTNSSRVYTNLFRDGAALRYGRWNYANDAPANATTNREYTATQNTLANPASAMGMKIGAYKSGTTVKAGKGSIKWLFGHPAGITTVTATGLKYRFSGTTWPTLAALQSSANNKDWTTEYNEATPASLATWTALTNNSVAESITSGALFVRFILEGACAAKLNEVTAFEINTVTVALNSSNVIQGSMRAVESIINLDMYLYNTSNGSIYFRVQKDMVVNDTLYIDTENFTCKSKGIEYPDAVDVSAIRSEWLPLLPDQTNRLTYVSGSPVATTIVTKWRDRKMA